MSLLVFTLSPSDGERAGVRGLVTSTVHRFIQNNSPAAFLFAVFALFFPLASKPVSIALC